MTFFADRNNIKPMFRGIALVVVIYLCLCGAIMTLQGINWRQFASLNGVFYSILCLTSFGMANLKAKCFFSINNFTLFTLTISLLRCFTFLALSIAFLISSAFLTLLMTFVCSSAFFSLIIASPCGFAFFALVILFATNFTIRPIAVFCSTVFIKFRQRFDFFAFGTSFRYDFGSHNRLLYRRLRLEPVAVYTTAVGSLYNMTTIQLSQ